MGSKTKLSVSRKKNENRKKATKRKTNATELRKKRAGVIFRSFRGSLVASEYRPDIYRFPLDHIEEETIQYLLHKLTNPVCVIYLQTNARSQDLVHSFCYLLGLKLSCLVMFVLLVCDLCQTTYTL